MGDDEGKYRKLNMAAHGKLQEHLRQGRRLAVALDANTYIAMKGDFKRASMKTLQRLMEAQSITLLFPQIWERETKKHLTAALTQVITRAATKMDDALTEALPVLHEAVTTVRNQLKNASAADIVSDRFERHLEDFKGQRLPTDTASTSEVFDAYFAVKNPFTQEKPREFPDAFALSSLAAYAKATDQYVLVVSRDLGPLGACLESERLIGLSSVEEVVRSLQSKREVVELQQMAEVLDKLWALEVGSRFRDTFQAALRGSPPPVQLLGMDSSYRPLIEVTVMHDFDLVASYPKNSRFNVLATGKTDFAFEAHIKGDLHLAVSLNVFDADAGVEAIKRFTESRHVETVVQGEAWFIREADGAVSDATMMGFAPMAPIQLHAEELPGVWLPPRS